MDMRIVLCEFCSSEGRILRSDGGPYDTDCGRCPICDGFGSIIVTVQPIKIVDLEEGAIGG